MAIPSIFLLISFIMLLAGIIFTLRWLHNETNAGSKLLVITLLSILSIAFLRYPLYMQETRNIVDAGFCSIVDALQTLGLNTDLGQLLEDIPGLFDGFSASFLRGLIENTYITFTIIQYFVALVMCGFAALRAISSMMQRLFYRNSRRPVFIFSGLTENSMQMAASIQHSLDMNQHKAHICFAGTTKDHPLLTTREWIEADIENPVFIAEPLCLSQFPRRSSCINCILCESDEDDNLSLLFQLLEESKASRPPVSRSLKYFIFARSHYAEEVIDTLSLTANEHDTASSGGSGKKEKVNKNTLICILNPEENLAIQLLEHVPLHEYAAPSPQGGQELNILIAGHTPLAERFLHNAYSVGQMLDCRLSITIADTDADTIQAELYGNAPLLRHPEHPVIQECGQLRFHKLNHPSDIYDEELLRDKHYILLAREDGRENLHIAQQFRMIIDRQKLTDARRAAEKIAIVYIVEDPSLNHLCQSMDRRVVNTAFTPCSTFAMGSRNLQLQIDTLLSSAPLRRAFLLDLAYSHTELPRTPELRELFISFLNHLYNSRSSISAALHLKYRQTVLKNASAVELAALEHRRWNAAMIMMGYLPPSQSELEGYFYRGDATHREPNLRLHPCIVPSSTADSIDLWDESIPAVDPLDQLSRQLHRLRLDSLRRIFDAHSMADQIPQKPTQADKAALRECAAQLPDHQDAKHAKHMANSLFTDFRAIDRDLVSATPAILDMVSHPRVLRALQLFWMEDENDDL